VAAVPLLIFGCGAAPQKESIRSTEVVIPPVPENSPMSEGRVPEKRMETSQTLIPTNLRLVRTGNTFLAYVSVPDGDGWRDLDEPKVDFQYSFQGGRLMPVPGCEKVFSCDVSPILRFSWPAEPVHIHANFSSDGHSPSFAVDIVNWRP
jgi:hypothetical protein